ARQVILFVHRNSPAADRFADRELRRAALVRYHVQRIRAGRNFLIADDEWLLRYEQRRLIGAETPGFRPGHELAPNLAIFHVRATVTDRHAISVEHAANCFVRALPPGLLSVRISAQRQCNQKKDRSNECLCHTTCSPKW